VSLRPSSRSSSRWRFNKHEYCEFFGSQPPPSLPSRRGRTAAPLLIADEPTATRLTAGAHPERLLETTDGRLRLAIERERKGPEPSGRREVRIEVEGGITMTNRVTCLAAGKAKGQMRPRLAFIHFHRSVRKGRGKVLSFRKSCFA